MEVVEKKERKEGKEGGGWVEGRKERERAARSNYWILRERARLSFFSGSADFWGISCYHGRTGF